MKRVIKSASFGGYQYQYEVYWMVPGGGTKLLGAFNNIESAEKCALNNLDRIYENPWETPRRKAAFIENCFIVDIETDEDVTTDAVIDKQDALLSMLQ